MEMKLVELTDATGQVVDRQLLLAAESVHRQLRPQLAADYAQQMLGIFADGGRMVVVLNEAQEVLGVAVYRQFRNTFSGLRFYVDDLITHEASRSTGVGRMLLDYLEQKAREAGAPGVELESGTQRERAHHFYFRQGYSIPSFSFRKLF